MESTGKAGISCVSV